MLRKEFKKKKVIYATILIFVILSALLMTVGTSVIMKTTGSMESLFEIAKPPHFLQMHTGEINQNEIEQFSKKQDYVIAEETVEMLNIDAASIWFEKRSGQSTNSASNAVDNKKMADNFRQDNTSDAKGSLISMSEI